MAISRKCVSLGISSLVLAVLLNAPAVAVRTEATATPVPFPQAPASLPAEADLQATLTDLQGFMAQVDRYIKGVYVATEDYRQYVGRVKEMLAGCEVEFDVSDFEGTGFENFVAAGGDQCKSWVAGFDQQARSYAAQLDEAVAFQKLLEKVGGRAQRQIDRARIALHAKGLKRAVDQGLREVDNTREAIKPWMDSQGKNR